jgi:hypothetical protein
VKPLLIVAVLAAAVLIGLSLSSRRTRKEADRAEAWHATGDTARSAFPAAPLATATTPATATTSGSSLIRRQISSTPARYGWGVSDPQDASVRVGDALVVDGQPAAVLATIGYAEDVFEWSAVMLALGQRRRWLTLVSIDDRVEAVLWEKLIGLPTGRGGKSLTYSGKTYELRERGTARYEAHGEVDLAEHGEVEYVDYEAADGARLSFENYDAWQWEASTGTVLPLDRLARA